MIALQLNKRDFEYDAHSLIRAFYPGTDVTIFYDEEATCPDPCETAHTGRKDSEETAEEAWDLKIRLDYQEDHIALTLCGPDGTVLDMATEDVDYYVDRKETKNRLKYRLYQMLSAYTGQTLPWGTLTGIRPTKIPMAFLEQGKKPAWIAQYMREKYLTSPEKTALGISIAVREKALLEKISYQDGYSLYIGIPFCPSICLYCSFSSSPLSLWEDKVDLYLDALCKEIAYGAEEYRGRTLTTVYIGGGTPTTLNPAQMERLLTEVETHFDLSNVQEFTVEAGRPDSITREKLEVLKRHPVTRISINPQTMNQKTLEIIGRRHTVEQTKEAFLLAREMGFDNINMDLIVGLPGEEKSQVEETMRQVSDLNPDSITVHSLAVKRAARLNMFKDQYKELTFVNSCEIMDMTAAYAGNLGMFPYYLYRQKNMAGNFENVGYARPGKEGLYNILIMEEKQSILALGAGASTKVVAASDRIDRIENVKDIKSYIERIDEMIERKRQGFLKYGK
ncbi:MAG: coproporphyrinogen dehydrogenase HemZ [Eubacteriales bacterium]|nr:coproporphyrinogen dehydrogenase HemZ [Eubacteriales bacterium]